MTTTDLNDSEIRVLYVIHLLTLSDASVSIEKIPAKIRTEITKTLHFDILEKILTSLLAQQCITRDIPKRTVSCTASGRAHILAVIETSPSCLEKSKNPGILMRA